MLKAIDSPIIRSSGHPANHQMHTKLAIHLHDLLAEYTLTHAFRNTGSKAIEATYTFPIPLDAAFMGMRARVGNMQREAVIYPAKKAQTQYDNAISDGDSAVLLEQLEPGLLCVSLGNLLPSEDGEITLQFVASIPVAKAEARFSLPLVHRPRYGRYTTPAYAVPEYSLTVENTLEAEITVSGLLLQADVMCPLPGIKFSRQSESMSLNLANNFLDRDLVLVFTLPKNPDTQALVMPDGDRALAYATLIVPESDQAPTPVNLCLVMDCSGSMSGDAIQQSRDALRTVSNRLTDDDHIQVIRFGSHHIELFRRPLKASAVVRNAMHELVNTVQADLGGTEMDNALQIAIKQLGNDAEENRVIILVTDGAVQPEEIANARRAAEKSGIRIFVVAVGSSAGVDALQPLAEATKGTLERATPAESIDNVVLRHLSRARNIRMVSIHTDWGKDAEPLPVRSGYPGDSVTLLAWLPSTAPHNMTISFNEETTQKIALQASPKQSFLRTWAGKQLYEHTPAWQKEAIALRYGLLSRETSAVLVHERAAGEKQDSLPEMVTVKQMLPYGYMLDKPAYNRRPATSKCPPPTPKNMLNVSHFSKCYISECSDPEPDTYLNKKQINKLLSHLEIAQILFEYLAGSLLNSSVVTLNKDMLLKLLSAKQQALLTTLLNSMGLNIDTTKDAITLLEELLENGVGTLTDEQEARLSLLKS